MDYFNPTLWSWPQIIILLFGVLVILVAITKHGQPKVDKDTGLPHNYNGFGSLFVWLLIILILAAGGFFAGGVHHG